MSRILGSFVSVILFLACTSAPASAQPRRSTDKPDLLTVIPENCLGFIAVRDVRALDDKLARLLRQMGLEADRPLASLIERLNLGPKIASEGSFAIVIMPAETMTQLGAKSVLVFRCEDVEALLSSFPTSKLSDDVWRSELVWGPTYVGRKGSFAVFGSTEDATRTVLSSPHPLADVFTESQAKSFSTSDASIWVNVREALAGPALEGWVQRLDQRPEGASFFGRESLFACDSRFLKQIDSIHVGLRLDSARIMASASIKLQGGSTLSKLLSFAAPSEESSFALLPEGPFVFAAAGVATPDQMKLKAAELDKLLESETIAGAIDPEKLALFRDKLKRLVGSIRGGAWGLTSLPEGPNGLVGVAAVLKVTDSMAWLADIQTAVGALGEGFFVNPEANHFYKSVRYQAQAEVLDAVVIGHLKIELVEPAPPAKAEGIDYVAALGSGEYLVRIARLDRNTVMVHVGGQRGDARRLIASAKGLSKGLDRQAGFLKVRALLEQQHNAEMYFSLEEAFRLGRTLARIQDKVEQFPYRLPQVDAPVAATLTSDGATCHLQIAVPIDLLVGLKDTVEQLRGNRAQVQAPPSGN